MQKFRKNDYVKVIAPDHDERDDVAVIEGSYKDLYGGSMEGGPKYSVYCLKSSKCAWYDEDDFELIEHDREDLITAWKAEAERLDEIRSNRDWIFKNGREVLRKAYVASVTTLFHDLGGEGSLWGSRGEGITLYINTQITLRHAAPFLETGDVDGWLRHTTLLKQAYEQRKAEKGTK